VVRKQREGQRPFRSLGLRPGPGDGGSEAILPQDSVADREADDERPRNRRGDAPEQGKTRIQPLRPAEHAGLDPGAGRAVGAHGWRPARRNRTRSASDPRVPNAPASITLDSSSRMPNSV